MDKFRFYDADEEITSIEKWLQFDTHTGTVLWPSWRSDSFDGMSTIRRVVLGSGMEYSRQTGGKRVNYIRIS